MQSKRTRRGNLPTSHHKAIGLKWVYKTMKDSVGKVVKHKARLVAKGFVQRQAVDFDEVFAPVVRLDTVRLILALAAQYGWVVHHLDVKSAFLNGDLEGEVYVTQPEGYVDKKQSHKVLKLLKALYGLRQAPRAWNVRLDRNMKGLGFSKCSQDPTAYTRNSKTKTLIVGVYVDELIITGSNNEDIMEFKDQMKNETPFVFGFFMLFIQSVLTISFRRFGRAKTMHIMVTTGKLQQLTGSTESKC